MTSSLPPPIRAREPILNLPGVVAVFVLALIAIHAIRAVFLSDQSDLAFLLNFAVVPARWAVAWDPSQAEAVLRDATEGFSGREALVRRAMAQFIVADAEAKPWTFLTYAALHGSWGHVLLNSVWLAAFGTPVARRCGALRFTLISAAAALGGSVAHVLLHPLSVAPMIGASAAVSGLMAAAARFVFSPIGPGRRNGRGGGEVHTRPTQSFDELLRNRRAALFLVIWFATNLLFGLIATPLGVTDASIAWEAHIGGFLVGLFLFPFLDGPRSLPDE